MKFSCEKHLLQAAVAAASRAASAKSPISALEGLLIEAGSGVRVTGYDLKKGIYMNIEADVAQPGSAVLMTAKLFSEMMRLLPDGIVTVEVGDDSRASVRCGQSEYGFMALPAADYPELPEVDESEAVRISQKALRSMIDESIFAVSTNESRRSTWAASSSSKAAGSPWSPWTATASPSGARACRAALRACASSSPARPCSMWSGSARTRTRRCC